MEAGDRAGMERESRQTFIHPRGAAAAVYRPRPTSGGMRFSSQCTTALPQEPVLPSCKANGVESAAVFVQTHDEEAVRQNSRKEGRTGELSPLLEEVEGSGQ